MLMSRSVQTPVYTTVEETGEQDVRNAGWHEKRQGLGCVSEALSSECAARSEVGEVMKTSESDERAAYRKCPGGVAPRSVAGARAGVPPWAAHSVGTPIRHERRTGDMLGGAAR